MLRLYTDESPGLKVDPVVVLVLSLVFIFSVVALHSEFFSLVVLFLVEFLPCLGADLLMGLVVSYRQDYSSVLELDGLMRKGLGEREERLRVGRGYDTRRQRPLRAPWRHTTRGCRAAISWYHQRQRCFSSFLGCWEGWARYLGKTNWGYNKT